MGRGERILEAIHEDISHKLNPSGDDCWHCGGEGYTHDCIDGCCENAAEGCAECEQRCPECAASEYAYRNEVRKAVIESGDVDVAVAWLKEIGRWRDDITTDRVQEELQAAASKSASQ